MQNIIRRTGFLVLGLMSASWAKLAVAADGVPSPIGNNSMQAASPFTEYTAAVVGYVLLIGVLVSVLLIGAFLVLNLGLMSKRKDDRIGGRTPSDVALLKNTVWPEEEDDSRTLPAEEDEVDEHDRAA